MSSHPHVSRRRFLQTTAAGLAATAFLPGTARPAANDRLTLGFIGIGVMGRGHLATFLRYPEVQVVAVCDVVAERRAGAHKMVEDHYKKPNSCQAYTDYRKLLAH